MPLPLAAILAKGRHLFLLQIRFNLGQRPNPPHIVRYTIRLNRAQGEHIAALAGRQQFPAGCRAVLWQCGCGSENTIDLREQVFQGVEFGLIRGHISTIRARKPKSRR